MPLQGRWYVSRSQVKASVFGNRATHRAVRLPAALQNAKDLFSCQDGCQTSDEDKEIMAEARQEKSSRHHDLAMIVELQTPAPLLLLCIVPPLL